MYAIIVHAFILFVILPLVIGAAFEWLTLGAAALWWLVCAPFRLWAWGWTQVFGEEPDLRELKAREEAMWIERERKLEAHLQGED